MTQQRLYQPVTGTVDAKGQVILTFPAVPQGSAWTGSVSLYIQPAYSPGLNPTLSHGALQGSMWWLTRNQSPILQMAGGCTAVDVQCVGQEVLTVTGAGLSSGDTVVGVWSGWSDDMASAVLCEPHAYGVTAPYMQVYNSGGITGPLDVTVVDNPARTVAVAHGFAANPSSTVGMISASTHDIRLMSANIQLSTSQSGTTVQNNPCLASLVLDDGTTQTTVLAAETLVIQDSSQAVSVSLELHDLPVVSNQAVELVTGALAAGTLRVNATVIYSYIPTPP